MSEHEFTTDDDFDPVYQKGKTSVSHKNIDAAGDNHPLGTDPLSWQADLRSLIRKVADDLYQSWEATIREYLANAETACLRVQNFVEGTEDTVAVDELYGVSDGYEPRIEVTWDRSEDKLTIRDNGIGMASTEIEEVFRVVGNSAARDSGSYSGQFGMGVLSFPKFTGVDNSMVMTTHSRQTDENFSTYITLAGPEPIVGSMPNDQYGTKFQMTPKRDDEGNLEIGDVRDAVSRYAEYIRVPVLYVERDESGEEVFNDEYGDKTLSDDYADEMVTLTYESPGDFVAYCSADASGETLLLSMPIERNVDSADDTFNAPFPFDVRLFDESGKVVKSDNGNEGLMPCARSDYERMLLDAREPYITETLLASNDVVGQQVAAGPNTDSIVVNESVLSGDTPLPTKYTYLTTDDLSDDDEPGQHIVVSGNNEGRVLVDEETWSEMNEGRAENYVPEDELTEFDPQDESGDLRLPEPTSDRDRLKQHDTFFKYIGLHFRDQFEDQITDLFEEINQFDDPERAVEEIDPTEILHDVRDVEE